MAGLGFDLLAALIAAFVYRDNINPLAHLFDDKSIVPSFRTSARLFRTAIAAKLSESSAAH